MNLGFRVRVRNLVFEEGEEGEGEAWGQIRLENETETAIEFLVEREGERERRREGWVGGARGKVLQMQVL